MKKRENSSLITDTGDNHEKDERRTALYLQKMKERGEKIVMVCPAALPPVFTGLCEEAGVDVIRYTGFGKDIVSRAENIFWMTEKLRAAASLIHLNAYLEPQQMGGKYASIENSRRVLAAGADSVVTTGLANDTVKLLSDCGMPVFTHVGGYTGWMPRIVFRRVGESAEQAFSICRMAYEYQEAGAIGITLEGTPKEVSRIITENLRIPVIGLSANYECDGTELLADDLLGMKKTPEKGMYAKRYVDLRDIILSAFGRFVEDVRSCEYTDGNKADKMDETELEKLKSLLRAIH